MLPQPGFARHLGQQIGRSISSVYSGHQRLEPGNLPDYLESFAAEQFGPAEAPAIGRILGTYYRLGYQRKPEHLQWYVGKEPPANSEAKPSYADAHDEYAAPLSKKAQAEVPASAAAEPPGCLLCEVSVEYPVIGSRREPAPWSRA